MSGKINLVNGFIRFIILSFLFSLPVILQAQGNETNIPDLVFERLSFSPNNNGYADRLLIRPGKISRRLKDLRNWKIEIKNAAGETVKSFSADKRLISERYSIRNFYFPDKNRPERLHIFKEISWDGKNERAEPMPAGEYRIIGWVQTGNRTNSLAFREYKVSIVLNPAEVNLKPLRTRISLHRDPALLLKGETPASVLIKQEISGTEDYTFKGEILDQNQKVRYSQEWKKNLPVLFQWKGMRSARDNDYMKTGIYTYRLSVADSALNFSEDSYRDITISEQQSNMEILCDKKFFSPGRDRLRCKLSPYPDDQKFLKDWQRSMAITEWKFEILDDEDGEVVYSRTAKGAVPDFLEWDGRDNLFRPVSDHVYYIRITADTAYGFLKTPAKPVIADSAAPDTVLIAGRSEFKPDEFGNSQKIRFYLLGNDASGIGNWNLTIYLKTRNQRFSDRIPYRTFSGKGKLPKTVDWYGESDNGIQTESFEKYFAELTVTDNAGNTSVDQSNEVTSGPVLRLMANENRNLHMIIPGIGVFSEDKELLPEADRILAKTVKELKEYPFYNINVMVTESPDKKTDHRTSILFTEHKALQVYEQLKRRGIPANRLKYEGLGFTEPLNHQTDPVQIFRNSRVQIVLTPISK
jgi:outer membrane protein OmpA-like peptidoglycan-associated protein